MSNPYIVYMAPVRPPGWKPVKPATEAPKPPESKPFKRSKSVVNGMRRREEGGQRSHLNDHTYISRRLAELQKREKELEEEWERIRTDCKDYHENIQYWRVGDKVIVRREQGMHKSAYVGTVQELMKWKSRTRIGFNDVLAIQETLSITSVKNPIQYEHAQGNVNELWYLTVNDTPETRKLVYEIMCVASEIRHLSEKLRK